MIRDDGTTTSSPIRGGTATSIRERRDLFEQLQELEPPFIITVSCRPGGVASPRIDAVEVAGAGDALVGIPVVRVSTGPAGGDPVADDPHALEPGDVLVRADYGSGGTRYSSRRRGRRRRGCDDQSRGDRVERTRYPVRRLVTDGTRRIPDGATVTVNGTAGTVTIH